MATKISAALNPSVNGAILGTYLGPWGTAGGAALGFIVGCLAANKVETGVKEGWASTNEQMRGVIRAEAKRFNEDIDGVIRTEARHFSDRISKQVEAQGQMVRDNFQKLHNEVQKFQYAASVVAFSVLGYFSLPATYSLNPVMSFFARSFVPVSYTVAWVNGLAYFRSAVLKQENVTFVNAAARAVAIGLGTLMMYGGGLAMKVAHLGTYDSGEGVFPSTRWMCGLISVPLYCAGALIVHKAIFEED